MAGTSEPDQSLFRQADSAVRRTTQHDTGVECHGDVSGRPQNDMVEIKSEQADVHPRAENCANIEIGPQPTSLS